LFYEFIASGITTSMMGKNTPAILPFSANPE
jgi:hypothetical protein